MRAFIRSSTPQTVSSSSMPWSLCSRRALDLASTTVIDRFSARTCTNKGWHRANREWALEDKACTLYSGDLNILCWQLFPPLVGFFLKA